MKPCFSALSVVLLLGAGISAHADEKEAVKGLLEKAIVAHGGEENLAKFKAIVMTMEGTLYVQGMEIPYSGTWSIQMPGQTRVELNLKIADQAFTQINVLNKDKGWISLNGNTMEMSEDILAEARQEMHSGWVCTALYPLRDEKKYELSPLGTIDIDDNPAEGIRVRSKGFRPVNIYFDKQTHLLVKAEYQAKDIAMGGKEVLQELLFADYKKVAGVMSAHRLKLKRDGEDFLVGKVTDVQMFDSLDESTFAKP